MVQVTQAGRRHKESYSSPDGAREAEGYGVGDSPIAHEPDASLDRGYPTSLLWQGPDRTRGIEQGLLKSTPCPNSAKGDLVRNVMAPERSQNAATVGEGYGVGDPPIAHEPEPSVATSGWYLPSISVHAKVPRSRYGEPGAMEALDKEWRKLENAPWPNGKGKA